jgi:threonyl-tRNA synthetase
MKSVLLHCKNYKSKIGKLANHPTDISPEPIKEKKQSEKNCIVALITVEKGDNPKRCSEELDKEISAFAQDVKVKNIVIIPFAHLSNNPADSKTEIKFFEYLQDQLAYNLNVTRGHYGSDKALLLDIKGHKGNVRFREFQ